jgi:hypothetical protein
MKYFASGAEKLRVYLALSLGHLGHAVSTEASETWGTVLRRTSRARIYDLRSYAKEAHWAHSPTVVTV